jgi:hypothetical protein
MKDALSTSIKWEIIEQSKVDKADWKTWLNSILSNSWTECKHTQSMETL